MPLNIRNEEVNRLAQKLASEARVSKTEAVRVALENELQRRNGRPSLIERLKPRASNGWLTTCPKRPTPAMMIGWRSVMSWPPWSAVSTRSPAASAYTAISAPGDTAAIRVPAAKQTTFTASSAVPITAAIRVPPIRAFGRRRMAASYSAATRGSKKG